MTKLKTAIVGCGTVSREHLAALSQLRSVDVVAVCDLSPARAEATAERFGIGKWYTDHRELLRDTAPDVMHITTPPASHFPIATDCLKAGIHTFCEKPITITYDDFCTLRQVVVENRCLLLENHNYRFHSSMLRINHLLNSGTLGDIVDVQIFLCVDIYNPTTPYTDSNVPYFATELPAGIIGDFLTHIASLATMFSGNVVDLRSVWTKRGCGKVARFDEFRALLRGEGTTASIAFSGNAQPEGFWVRVVGTRGQVEANLFEPPRLTLRRMRSGEPAIAKVIDGLVEARDTLNGTIRGFGRKLAGTSSYDGLPELIARIYRALERHEPPPISLQEIDQVAWLVDRFSQTELQL
jgi:predicted dehydrogenase